MAATPATGRKQIVVTPAMGSSPEASEAAIARGGRSPMVYTLPPAKESMEHEFREKAARRGADAQIECVFVPGPIEAVKLGDVETHNRRITQAAGSLSGFQSVTLAQFSMARALATVQVSTLIPVFSSPEQAVLKLRDLIAKA